MMVLEFARFRSIETPLCAMPLYGRMSELEALALNLA